MKGEGGKKRSVSEGGKKCIFVCNAHYKTECYGMKQMSIFIGCCERMRLLLKLESK